MVSAKAAAPEAMTARAAAARILFMSICSNVGAGVLSGVIGSGRGAGKFQRAAITRSRGGGEGLRAGPGVLI